MRWVRLLIYSLALSCGSGEFNIISAVEGDSLWSRTFGGPDFDYANAMLETTDGGYLLTGYTSSFGTGGEDLWVVKTDGSGDSLWAYAYGDLDWEWGYDLVESADGGFLIVGTITSYTSGWSDLWLLKIGANGDSLWSRTYGGEFGEGINSIISIGGDQYVIAGWSESFGSGGADVWLLKVNANGDTLWTRTYGGALDDFGYDVIAVADGYLIGGGTTSFGSGASDVWLVKTNENGDSLWSRTYGGSGDEYAFSMLLTSDDQVVLGGWTDSFGSGGFDLLLLKTETNGDSLWLKTFGGAGDEAAHDVVEGVDGGYLAAGWTYSNGFGQADMWLLKTDSEGDSLWSRTYGGASDEYAYSLIRNSAGEYVLSGWTQSYGSGGWDVWLVGVEGWSPSGVESNNALLPNRCALNPAFPNPFNPATAISYQLAANSLVNLRVYDVSGRLVATLVEDQQKAGFHKAHFDGSDFASGVYLYRLEAGSFSAVGKMVLLK